MYRKFALVLILIISTSLFAEDPAEFLEGKWQTTESMDCRVTVEFFRESGNLHYRIRGSQFSESGKARVQHREVSFRWFRMYFNDHELILKNIYNHVTEQRVLPECPYDAVIFEKTTKSRVAAPPEP